MQATKRSGVPLDNAHLTIRKPFMDYLRLAYAGRLTLVPEHVGQTRYRSKP
jgi:hypothetical protein